MNEIRLSKKERSYLEIEHLDHTFVYDGLLVGLKQFKDVKETEYVGREINEHSKELTGVKVHLEDGGYFVMDFDTPVGTKSKIKY